LAFQKRKIFGIKNIAEEVAKFLENDFWQYFPNLAPSGNLALSQGNQA